MDDQPRILVVANDVAAAGTLCGGLSQLGFEVTSCTAEQAKAQIIASLPDLIVSTAEFDQAWAQGVPVLRLIETAEDHSGPYLRADASVLQIASRAKTLIRLAVVERIARLRAQDARDFGVNLDDDLKLEDDPAILFVGDPSPAFMRIQHSLASSNVQTIAAFSTFNAFDYLHERAFDAVVLNATKSTDLAYTVCSAMRRNTRLFHTPAILLTSDNCQFDIEEAFARGASELMHESAPGKALKNQMQALNDERRRRRMAKIRLESCRNPVLLDQTTDLYNAEFGLSHLDSLLAEHSTSNSALTIVGIHADAPQSAGPQQIERALNQFASMLRHCVRAEDFAVRQDSRNFYLVLPNTGQTGAETVSSRVAAISECTAYESADPRNPFRLDLQVKIQRANSDNDAETLVASIIQPTTPSKTIAAVV